MEYGLEYWNGFWAGVLCTVIVANTLCAIGQQITRRARKREG